uniref:Centromere protein H n=1 Tax=Xenopus tropicalis TaxID=8364 RepID=A0A803JXG4_XENTR
MEFPEPLGDMQELSRELHRVSLLGACGQESPEEEAPELHLHRLLRLREQVKHQRLEVQAVNEASEEISPEALSSEKLSEIAKELLKDIEDVKVSFQNKTMVLQRLIQEKFTHILMLSSSVMNLQQETRDLEEKMYDIRKKRLVLKEQGSAKMLEIQTMKSNWKANREEMKNEKIKRLHKVLKEEIDSVTVLQNVFQNIILASHVDWAKYPQLKDIVLRLETNASSFV